MDALEMLKTRRSCRKFINRPVAEKDLQEILACGLNAPSATNQQDTKIIIVEDAQTVAWLSQLNKRFWRSDSDPFYGAPMVCLIIAPKSNGNGVKDGSLVIGAMQDAAYALDVGSCWINRCKEMLETDEGAAWLSKLGLADFVGVGCCILGYPAQRLPVKTIKEGRIVRL